MMLTALPRNSSPDQALDVEAETVANTLEDALTLNRVTETAWQVCDARFPPHSPGFLLGFVEHVGDGVELMQLGDHFIWTGFPTMREALEHVCATAYTTPTVRSAGAVSWTG